MVLQFHFSTVRLLLKTAIPYYLLLFMQTEPVSPGPVLLNFSSPLSVVKTYAYPIADITMGTQNQYSRFSWYKHLRRL